MSTIINFKNEQNEKAWNQFYDNFIENYQCRGNKTKQEQIKSARLSINQYKPVLLELERIVNNEFSKMTVEDLRKVFESKQDRIAHCRSALISMVNVGLISLDREVMLELLPSEYREFVGKMMFQLV